MHDLQRSRYLNSTKTLSALLNYGVIPIVNENDTVSVSEIKFGDNDTLSAITASMVSANYLFLLTDVDCLYTDNPRRFPDKAKQVRIVRDIEHIRELVSTSTMGSNLGTGGMETKIIAAELAINAGVTTVITHGKKPDNILKIVNSGIKLDNHYLDDYEAPPSGTRGDSNLLLLEEQERKDLEYAEHTPLHTVFLPEPNPLPDKRWWVVHGPKPRGRIIIDEGAYRAIARSTVNASNSTSTPSTPRAITSPASFIPQSHTATSSSSSSVPSTSSPLTPMESASAVPSPSLLATSSAQPLNASSSTSTTNPTTSSSSSSSNSGNGGRLLPAGVIAVEGTFAAGQAVTIVVQRKRRRGALRGGRRDGSDGSTSGTAPFGAAKARQNSTNRSGNSSLANSLILEQAKQLGDPYDTNQSVTSTATSTTVTPEGSRPTSPSPSSVTAAAAPGSTSKRQEKRNRKKREEERRSELSDFDNETTTDDDHDDAEDALEQIEFGRGLANYNYQEIDRIKGHKRWADRSVVLLLHFPCRMMRR